MSEMSTEMREMLTKKAIIDCICESSTITQYFKDNPKIDPENGVDLGKVIDLIDEEYKKKFVDSGIADSIGDPLMRSLMKDDMSIRHDDPYLDILRDYRDRCENNGTTGFSDLKIRDFTQEEGLGKYVTVQTGVEDGEPTYQVCFSGTGNREGVTDAQGMYQASTVQQQRALKYFYDRVDDLNIQKGHVDLGGHSNGGNKDGYVLMNAYGKYQDAIRHCLSIDGQGYSKESIEQWKESPLYEEKIKKLYGLYGEYDYVHPLGESVVSEDRRFYVNFDENLFTHTSFNLGYDGPNSILRGVFGITESDGDPFNNIGMLHILNYLFKTDENGYFIAELQDDSVPSELVNLERQFMDSFMDLPPYKQEKAKTLLMQLWSGCSPDGTMERTDIFAILDSLRDCVGGTDQKAFMSFVSKLLTLVGVGDVFRNAILFVLSVNNSFADNPNSPLDGAYEEKRAYEKQQTETRNKARNSVAYHQGFAINPNAMLDLASNYQYLGGQIRDFQLEPWKKMKDTIIRKADLSMMTISSLEAEQREEYVRLARQLNHMIDNYSEACQMLEKCIETVNGTLTYLRDTANGFNRLEHDLASMMKGKMDF